MPVVAWDTGVPPVAGSFRGSDYCRKPKRGYWIPAANFARRRVIPGSSLGVPRPPGQRRAAHTEPGRAVRAMADP